MSEKDLMYVAITGLTYAKFMEQRNKALKFERKLFFILSNESENRYERYIRWEGDGMSFTVLVRDQIPRIFRALEGNERDRITQYNSFTKRLRRYGFRKQKNSDTWYHELFQRGNVVLLNRMLGEDDSSNESDDNVSEEDSPTRRSAVNRDQRNEVNASSQFADNQPPDWAPADGMQMGFNEVPHFPLQASRPERFGMNQQVNVRYLPSDQNFPTLPAIHVQDNYRSSTQTDRSFGVQTQDMERRQIRSQLANDRPTIHVSNDRRLGIDNNNAPHLLLVNFPSENVSVNQTNTGVPSMHSGLDAQENAGGNIQAGRMFTHQDQVNRGHQNGVNILQSFAHHRLPNRAQASDHSLENARPENLDVNQGNGGVSHFNNESLPLRRDIKLSPEYGRSLYGEDPAIRDTESIFLEKPREHQLNDIQILQNNCHQLEHDRRTAAADLPQLSRTQLLQLVTTVRRNNNLDEEQTARFIEDLESFYGKFQHS